MIIIILEKIFIVALAAITIAFAATFIYCRKQIKKYSRISQNDLAHKYLMVLPLCTVGVIGSIGLGSNCIINFWNSTSAFLCFFHGITVLLMSMALMIVYHVLRVKFEDD